MKIKDFRLRSYALAAGLFLVENWCWLETFATYLSYTAPRHDETDSDFYCYFTTHILCSVLLNIHKFRKRFPGAPGLFISVGIHERYA